jgi:hypothetical protein
MNGLHYDHAATTKLLVDTIANTLSVLNSKVDAVQELLKKHDAGSRSLDDTHRALTTEVAAIKANLQTLTDVQSKLSRIERHVNLVDRLFRKPIVVALFVIAVIAALYGLKELHAKLLQKPAAATAPADAH